MSFTLFIYFCVVFLGLQALYRFSKEVSLTLILIGNILIFVHCIDNQMWDLLILTILMMIAQGTRIYREEIFND
tara:strand:- start:39 stop:260 length:222 start_codon:yes stop_codon:yes gene_type:complete